MRLCCCFGRRLRDFQGNLKREVNQHRSYICTMDEHPFLTPPRELTFSPPQTVILKAFDEKMPKDADMTFATLDQGVYVPELSEFTLLGQQFEGLNMAEIQRRESVSEWINYPESPDRPAPPALESFGEQRRRRMSRSPQKKVRFNSESLLRNTLPLSKKFEYDTENRLATVSPPRRVLSEVSPNRSASARKNASPLKVLKATHYLPRTSQIIADSLILEKQTQEAVDLQKGNDGREVLHVEDHRRVSQTIDRRPQPTDDHSGLLSPLPEVAQKVDKDLNKSVIGNADLRTNRTENAEFELWLLRRELLRLRDTVDYIDIERGFLYT